MIGKTFVQTVNWSNDKFVVILTNKTRVAKDMLKTLSILSAMTVKRSPVELDDPIT